MKTQILSFTLALVLCGSAAAAGKVDNADALARPVQSNSLAGTSLKCAVVPPAALAYHTTACSATTPHDGYTVVNRVFPPAGGSYSYQWNVPSIPRQSIASGCTSTSDTCTLNITRAAGDTDNTIGVIVTDLSDSSTLSQLVSYSIPATCYWPGTGWVWC